MKEPEKVTWVSEMREMREMRMREEFLVPAPSETPARARETARDQQCERKPDESMPPQTATEVRAACASSAPRASDIADRHPVKLKVKVKVKGDTRLTRTLTRKTQLK